FPIPAIRIRCRTLLLSGTPGQWLDLARREIEPVSWLSQNAEVASRIVVHGDGQMYVAFVILLDAVDCRGLPGKGQVQNVCARPGPQPPPIAASEIPPQAPNMTQGKPLSQQPPLPFIHDDPLPRSGRFASCRAASPFVPPTYRRSVPVVAAP